MRVAAFMKDLETRALELGIPCKTRHNEVAPNQFELAPIFEETNLAVDHNMLIMSLMKRTARRHGFRCLLHEKPFAGINGSGKHCNWSLATDNGILLHGPGKTPLDNLRFVTFIVESLMAVYRHNGLLKASIISATNVHRLGASEAPPAIVSSFLGKQLSDLLEHLESSTDDELIHLSGKQTLSLDIPQIPELTQDNTDRNRTSPFAFTGNRFEFRAVGSQQNCAAAMIVLNTAMAEALTDFKERVDALIGKGIEPAWKQEAARRGLDVETSAPIILDQYLKPDTIEMFSRMNVLTKAELEARNEIKLDTYIKKVQIEARIFGDICMNHIIPVATRYQTQLIDNVCKMKSIFPAEEADRLNHTNLSLIQQMGEHNTFIIENVERLIEARRVANRIEDDRERAIAYHDTVAPLIEAIRYHVDHLELIVDDELWPLPKYREMLFIH